MSTSTQDPKVHVPSRLNRPHRFVATTREAARGARTDEEGRLQLRWDDDVVRVAVSKAHFRRALLILQAVFAEAERRGLEVKVTKDPWAKRQAVAIVIRGHSYPVAISEMTDRVPMTEPEIERWRTQNKWRLSYASPPTHKSAVNGRLRLTLPRHVETRQSNWTEGPRGRLEGKLGAVFSELEARAHADDRIAAERTRAAEERQRRLEEEMERQRLARIEDGRAKRLASEVDAWRRAGEVREYVGALRKRVVELPDAERDRVERWCDWAEAWVEWADPRINPARILGLDDDRPGGSSAPFSLASPRLEAETSRESQQRVIPIPRLPRSPD